MSIVFFGTTDTGWQCLQKIIEAGLEARGIVTGPKEFEISFAKEKVSNVRHRSFENFKRDFGIPILTFERKFDERVIATIREWNASLFVVIGWYYLIPARVRELAPLGTVGLHWSLLPKYRGGSPLVWAMIDGETETGASLFYMSEKIDAGEVIAQERAEIGAHDEVAQMIAKLNDLSGRMVIEHIPKILNGTANARPQNESAATYFPPRSPADGRIDWSWSAQRIYDFIRAQTLPYPCAFTEHEGKVIRIVKAAVQPKDNVHVCVKAGDGEWLGLETIRLGDETRTRGAKDYFQCDVVSF